MNVIFSVSVCLFARTKFPLIPMKCSKSNGAYASRRKASHLLSDIGMTPRRFARGPRIAAARTNYTASRRMSRVKSCWHQHLHATNSHGIKSCNLIDVIVVVAIINMSIIMSARQMHHESKHVICLLPYGGQYITSAHFRKTVAHVFPYWVSWFQIAAALSF